MADGPGDFERDAPESSEHREDGLLATRLEARRPPPRSPCYAWQGLR
jgi:hypothetical protein